MNKFPENHPGYSKPLLYLLTAFALCACEIGDSKLHFTEEVELADGDVLIVDRHVTARPFGEFGGPGGWESKYMSFEILTPTSYSNPPKWESTEGLVPMLFDKDPDTGEWTLLATFFSCEPWRSRGRPKLPYFEFRTKDGAWHEVSLDDKWIDRPANVYMGIRSGGEPDRVSLQMKRESLSRGISRHYLKIVNKWSTSC